MKTNIQLTFESGEYKSAVIPVSSDGEFTMGRDAEKCQLVFADKHISRRHCSVYYDRVTNEVVVRNDSQTSGLTVEHRKKADGMPEQTEIRKLNSQGESLRLSRGDKVCIGKTKESFTVTFDEIEMASPAKSGVSNAALAGILAGVGALIVCVAVVAVMMTGKKDTGDTTETTDVVTDDETTDTEVSTESIDYYNEISEKIISTYSAKDSPNVKTEDEAIDVLKERGLEGYDITTDMNMDGEIIDEVTVSDGGDTKHPSYMTYYTTEAGDTWVIYLIDDMVIANPFFYNAELEDGSMVMFSEKDSVISYDLYTNSYYEIVPKESSMDLKTIDRIDSSTLENYTADVIEKMD